MKVCNQCNKEKELEEFYNQSKKKANGEKYIYYSPTCKQCTIDRMYLWRKENPEQQLSTERKRRESNPEYFKNKRKNHYENNKEHEKEYYKNWISENKDRLPLYRNNHRNHDITDQEWLMCLEFFGHSCAYCGLSEVEQVELYNEQFHKEHVYHDGSNYIDNCVPSCTKCNTSKSDSHLHDWYNETNKIYSKRRFNRIVKWMTKECFKVLNLI